MARKREDFQFKLLELEGFIVQMLAYLAQPASSNILKNRLQQAENYVTKIPEGDPLSLEWREKLKNWWAIFASKGSDPIDLEEAGKTAPHVTITGGPSSDLAGKREFEKEPMTKEQILRFLVKMFREATAVEKPEHIEALKTLLGLVAKAESTTFSYMRDFAFQTTILELITPLLPKELRLKFLEDNEPPPPEGKSSLPKLPRDQSPKTLLTMKAFLIESIITLEEELREEQRIEALYYGVTLESPSNEGLNCSYCKEDGHDIVECPTIRRTLRCDNCFRHGHTAKACPLL